MIQIRKPRKVATKGKPKKKKKEKWPLNSSLSYDTILQLDLYCRKKFEWSELPHFKFSWSCI